MLLEGRCLHTYGKLYVITSQYRASKLQTKERRKNNDKAKNKGRWKARTRDNVARVHRIFVLNESEAIHELNLGDLASAMGGKVSLNIGFSSWGLIHINLRCLYCPHLLGASSWSTEALSLTWRIPYRTKTHRSGADCPGRAAWTTRPSCRRTYGNMREVAMSVGRQVSESAGFKGRRELRVAAGNEKKSLARTRRNGSRHGSSAAEAQLRQRGNFPM